MAGAGFKDFAVGEVLTAADVDQYLMQQSVMKFADATARDTALGTAVGGSNALREGMVAYLDDTDEVLAYDGTAWGSLGLPLGTATPTDGQILAFGTATSTWNPTDQLAGIGSNVDSYVKQNAFTSTSTSYTDIPGLSVTITPTSSSSKVLVFASATLSTDNINGQIVSVRLVRDATEIGGTTTGSNTGFGQLDGVEPFYHQATRQTLGIVDSPATTSAVTYHMEMKTTSNTGYINRAGQNSNDGGTSWLIAIEVAA